MKRTTSLALVGLDTSAVVLFMVCVFFCLVIVVLTVLLIVFAQFMFHFNRKVYFLDDALACCIILTVWVLLLVTSPQIIVDITVEFSQQRYIVCFRLCRRCLFICTT